MGNPHKIAAEIMETYSQDYEKMGFLNAVMYATVARNVSIRSKAAYKGWPLVNIATGYNLETGERNIARGIIAYGEFAVGVLAIGPFAAGVVAIGAMTVGGITLGALSWGILLALGAVGVSPVAAVGALAIAGGVSYGALSLGGYAAIGAVARGMHYVSEYSSSANLPAWMQALKHGVSPVPLIVVGSLAAMLPTGLLLAAWLKSAQRVTRM
jgi:hypothetical protein